MTDGPSWRAAARVKKIELKIKFFGRDLLSAPPRIGEKPSQWGGEKSRGFSFCYFWSSPRGTLNYLSPRAETGTACLQRKNLSPAQGGRAVHYNFNHFKIHNGLKRTSIFDKGIQIQHFWLFCSCHAISNSQKSNEISIEISILWAHSDSNDFVSSQYRVNVWLSFSGFYRANLKTILCSWTFFHLRYRLVKFILNTFKPSPAYRRSCRCGAKTIKGGVSRY